MQNQLDLLEKQQKKRGMDRRPRSCRDARSPDFTMPRTTSPPQPIARQFSDPESRARSGSQQPSPRKIALDEGEGEKVKQQRRSSTSDRSSKRVGEEEVQRRDSLGKDSKVEEPRGSSGGREIRKTPAKSIEDVEDPQSRPRSGRTSKRVGEEEVQRRNSLGRESNVSGGRQSPNKSIEEVKEQDNLPQSLQSELVEVKPADLDKKWDAIKPPVALSNPLQLPRVRKLEPIVHAKGPIPTGDYTMMPQTIGKPVAEAELKEDNPEHLKVDSDRFDVESEFDPPAPDQLPTETNSEMRDRVRPFIPSFTSVR
ncbi:hypothetical protein HDU98_004547 [Podochytrium sp. JEL0797]|nr:hypothetical protein HDU98_004547 [Podochytrium sp. JEL0797]